MIIPKADLFQDVSPETMNQITQIMAEESYDRGAVVFQAGTPASSFYLIVDGIVTLSIGTMGKIDYSATRPGEAFGWTGLAGRPAYVATAECSTPCKLIRIEKKQLEEILAKAPASGQAFYKNLAGAVVQRLIDNYGMFLTEGSLKGVSYGTGQMMGAED
jgi:CRP-like cAMP-binding protein